MNPLYIGAGVAVALGILLLTRKKKAAKFQEAPKESGKTDLETVVEGGTTAEEVIAGKTSVEDVIAGAPVEEEMEKKKKEWGKPEEKKEGGKPEEKKEGGKPSYIDIGEVLDEMKGFAKKKPLKKEEEPEKHSARLYKQVKATKKEEKRSLVKKQGKRATCMRLYDEGKGVGAGTRALARMGLSRSEAKAMAEEVHTMWMDKRAPVLKKINELKGKPGKEAELSQLKAELKTTEHYFEG